MKLLTLEMDDLTYVRAGGVRELELIHFVSSNISWEY
jgi:hypothetical protein